MYGRIFGEILKIMFPNFPIEPGAYAVIGAASIASSVTHTISTAVIAIELTKEINLLLPVLIVVLISVSTSRLLSESVYDLIIKQRELPLLPGFDLYAYVHSIFTFVIFHSCLIIFVLSLCSFLSYFFIK